MQVKALSRLARYDWRSDRLTVEGHVFSVRELLATLEQLQGMVETAQGDLFAEAA